MLDPRRAVHEALAHRGGLKKKDTFSSPPGQSGVFTLAQKFAHTATKGLTYDVSVDQRGDHQPEGMNFWLDLLRDTLLDKDIKTSRRRFGNPRVYNPVLFPGQARDGNEGMFGPLDTPRLPGSPSMRVVQSWNSSPRQRS